jgi:molecular chaperone HtpG
MNTNSTNINEVRTGARLLETLTSALYADPIVVFREYVQNAIDSFRNPDTRSADTRIDILLFPAERKIVIRDNGNGIPFDKFDETMMTLGGSSKGEDQIGFRGIGRLAGLSFCEKLVFRNKEASNGELKTFALDGEEYRKILSQIGGGNADLNTVMEKIKSTDTSAEMNQDGGDWSFEVSLEKVTDELMDCIYQNKPKRGRIGKQEKTTITGDSKPTEDFRKTLSVLLPVPYAVGFSKGEEIAEKYNEYFSSPLREREYMIFLNGEALVKPFAIDEEKDFRIIPIRIKDLRGETISASNDSEIIGLLWMSFDYVFKAVGENFGVAVRSKNMLVRGGSVLAEEASNSRDAVTTYGQYLSAIKGVTGELLLETKFLSDNSRRDWFKVDLNSLQLRDQLCQLMNRMHNYRYKISRYMHNDMRTDAEKQQVIAAYREFVDDNYDKKSTLPIEQYMQGRLQEENAQERNERADVRDILGYTMTQKQFYKTMMQSIYNYFEDKEITDYYALKSYILRELNQESNSSQSNAPKQGDN